jgi:enoyl-CoA hydratase
MAYQNLLSEVKENILYITINREKALNALNKDTLAELADVIFFASENDEVRGVILTGAGEKAFVAGADIKEFSDYNGKQGEELAKKGQENVFNAIEKSSKPFIAAINGFALGGGLELAMACHIRIASDQAKLGLPEVTLGLIPGYGGTQRLTQLVGKGKAIEMENTSRLGRKNVAGEAQF